VSGAITPQDGPRRPGFGLEEKNVVVLGVADASSIAWAIARAFVDHGARVHIGYQQKFFSRVRLLLQEFPAVQGGRCDVLKEDELGAYFERFGGTPVDVLVHAIAYGPPEVFTSHPSDVTADAFAQTLAISTHSLSKVVERARPVLRDGASVITFTFQASERAVPMYGMMGVAKAALESLVQYLALELGRRRIRVNAISPGPIETVAALGEVLAFLRDPEALARQRGRLFQDAIARARQDPRAAASDEIALAKIAWGHVQRAFAERCAIEEAVSQEDVADCAVFLGSDYARRITGQVIHVDCGLSSSLIM
jgi:enoyl-[acyl-carrier protein] reductase I